MSNPDHLTRVVWQADPEAAYRRGYRAGVADQRRMWLQQTSTSSSIAHSVSDYLYPARLAA